jgi:hypothetical protein
MVLELVGGLLNLVGGLCWLATVVWVASRYMRGWRLVWKPPTRCDDA